MHIFNVLDAFWGLKWDKTGRIPKNFRWLQETFLAFIFESWAFNFFVTSSWRPALIEIDTKRVQGIKEDFLPIDDENGENKAVQVKKKKPLKERIAEKEEKRKQEIEEKKRKVRQYFTNTARTWSGCCLLIQASNKLLISSSF